MEPTTAAEVRRRYAAPDAIRLEAGAREVLAWVDGAEDAVREVAAAPDALPRGGSVPAGRSALARLASPLGPLLVRENVKGGLLRRLRGAKFRGRYRPLDEMVLLRRLVAVGVPAPEAAGAVVLKSPSGWRGFLLVREVVGAIDLESWLYGNDGPSPVARRDVLASAGRAVRRLHDEGVAHADLHPRNLLLDPAARRVVVVDFDRAKGFDGPVPDETRLQNLVRLARAVEKHRLRGMRVSRRDALRFLSAYGGNAESGRRWLARVRGRISPFLPVRTLWWRVTGQAKPFPGGAAA